MIGAQTPDTSPARILVVDDNATNRYVLSTTLHRAGHEVVEAQDGTRALEVLQAQKTLPEVAIVDVRLPDMTGFELCERIKGTPETASVPVVHISASAISVRDRTQGLNRGADAYLTEPIAPDELLATVTATLRYARARRRAESLAERLHRLNKVTLALYSATDAQTLVTAAAEGAAAILGSEAAAVLTSPQGGVLAAHTGGTGNPGARLSELDLPSTTGLPGTAGAVGASLRSVPGGQLPFVSGTLTGHSALLLAVARAKSGRPPVCIALPPGSVRAPEDEELVKQLAHACALALEALRTYSEEHALALTLQRSFLPESLPSTVRADLAVRYLPASEHTEIGGDFYEALQTPAGLFVAVGDVAGHSLDAAMVMGQVRHGLRAYAAEGHAPEVVLAQLDRLLGTVEPGATVTLCVILIDASAEVMYVANAGHLPPLLRDPDGATRFVRSHGPLLGLGLPHPPAVEVAAPSGTTVVLATDGLIERRHEDLGDSLDALAAIVAEGPTDPEGLCTHLVERLPPDGSDDVALMAIRLRECRA
ncbi:fused response regulator/phosphatase [Streptomyces minutiscleroticus]|uniref:Uncharacterized protein n=1 Tax=Streptomyces minutiscleroticus TaxID=68238 RepID=A0A918NRH0_9ACTN|nr:fused response regulator/phosphatase [Streptomyces minutiscleroticus]GGX89675.1 hypothetical protein GCM10010358_49540 [Streptomyces minutiscleroticus]